ncbi:MAG: transglycosylase SLT domain-containing protein [Pseudomonadota bacterium]
MKDSASLKKVESDLQQLNRAVEAEIKFREEILPQLKKSAAVLSKYNPSLDYATAMTYAFTIYRCSDDDLPFDILTSLIVVESSADHKAVSRRGALGLMQVMPGTWDYDREVLFDPYKNIEAGSAILKYYIQRYGLIEGLRAYNSGNRVAVNSRAAAHFARKIVTIANQHF